MIYGIASGGQKKLLLVTKATKTRIVARHVHTQMKIEFGRDGRSKNNKGRGYIDIVSVRPLPPAAYSVVRGFERKMRLAQFPDGFLMSKDEIQVMLKIEDYFLARPLIDGEEPMEIPEGAGPAALDLAADN